MAAVTRVDDKTDLVYSEDENCWYFQRFLEGGETQESASYTTHWEAVEAYWTNSIVWEV